MDCSKRSLSIIAKRYGVIKQDILINVNHAKQNLDDILDIPDFLMSESIKVAGKENLNCANNEQVPSNCNKKQSYNMIIDILFNIISDKSDCSYLSTSHNLNDD